MKNFILASALICISSTSQAFIPNRFIDDVVIIQKDYLIFNTKTNQRVKVKTDCDLDYLRTEDDVNISLKRGIKENEIVKIRNNKKSAQCEIVSVSMS